MDNWIQWAFARSLGTGEKLVLVYLASLVSAAGVGRMDRAALAAATDYEPRSLQRLLKTLRDTGLLREQDGWFSLVFSHDTPFTEVPPADLHPGAAVSPPRAVTAGLSADELEAAGETIAHHMTEAANAHLVRFNDVSLRLLQGIEKIAQAARVWEENLADAVAPVPPDPVRESLHFKAFMTGGVLTELEAYELARNRLISEGLLPAAAALPPDAAQPAKVTTLVPRGATPARDSRQYLDSPLGRFERVRDILDPAGVEPWADAMAVWTRLEASENRHTVEGETDAFELLYPAIVTGARRWVGKMSLAEFLDEKAIAANRAAWDHAPAGVSNDPLLQAELGTMLDELERAGHPMCQAPPRTVDGALTEPLAAYHLRVLRVHQQLKKLQEMGV